MPREAGSGGAAVDQHRPICRYRKAKTREGRNRPAPANFWGRTLKTSRRQQQAGIRPRMWPTIDQSAFARVKD
jgi:hypothetical protein